MRGDAKELTGLNQVYPNDNRGGLGTPTSGTLVDPTYASLLELLKKLPVSDLLEKSRYCTNVNVSKLHYAELGTGTFWRTTAQLLDIQFDWWSVEGDLFRTANGAATWCQLPSIRYEHEIVPIHQIRFASRTLGWAVTFHLPACLMLYQAESHAIFSQNVS